MEKLPLEAVKEQITKMPQWELAEDKWLIKRYRFRSYLTGIAFVNKVAERSEEVNHHPFISIDYLVVTIKLTSWNARGITDLDLQLIKEYDVLYNDIVS